MLNSYFWKKPTKFFELYVTSIYFHEKSLNLDFSFLKDHVGKNIIITLEKKLNGIAFIYNHWIEYYL